jgi:hypothetical protein
MPDWNFDISEAPRGTVQEIEQTRVYSDKSVETVRELFVPNWLWLASKCGKVIKAHWIPEKGRDGGRWLGFNKGEEAVAWMPFVIPEHPHVSTPTNPDNGAQA